jgi:hypothetical protein
MAPCQKYIHVQAPTATMNKTPTLKVPLQTELWFRPAGMNNPTRLGGLRSNRRPTGGSPPPAPNNNDDDFCSEGPNNSSDDLRADAAAIGPSPTSSLERQGRAEGHRVGGQSVGGTGYLVGGETSSGCRGGRWHRKRLRSRSGQRVGHVAAASATNGKRPSPDH